MNWRAIRTAWIMGRAKHPYDAVGMPFVLLGAGALAAGFVIIGDVM